MTDPELGFSVYVPDGSPIDVALARTTHLGVGAHQDDLEILAIHGILSCFARDDRWFTGVVVADGAGSPRSGAYASFDAERMKVTRRQEQRKAAHVGEYSAVVELSHPSADIKTPGHEGIVSELERVLSATRPEVVYTHDLADRHETHVAVTLRLLEAARRLPPDMRPQRVLGCEVWRDLDWLVGPDRVVLPLGDSEHLERALLGVFDSQLAGGKRYDRASVGRRAARATFADSADVDRSTSAVLAMDLTPLLHGADPQEHVETRIRRFMADVRERLARLSERASG